MPPSRSSFFGLFRFSVSIAEPCGTRIFLNFGMSGSSTTTFHSAQPSVSGECPCYLRSDEDVPSTVTVNDPAEIAGEMRHLIEALT